MRCTGQKFIDWNYKEYKSNEFNKAEADIDSFYAEGNGKITSYADILLKDGE